MSAHRYRQLFLFLLVLTLPSIAIVVAGFRIAAQDEKAARQEGEQRAIAERRRTAEDIGKDLLSRLDQIKLQEIANATAVALPELGASSGVAAIGWLEGDRPAWTWDLRAPSDSVAPVSSDFSRAMDDAARAEFGERQYGSAVALYRQAIAAAYDENQRAIAQLGLARALWRSGSKVDAKAAYRDLLKLPTTIADEYGLPFASYAVEPLLELGSTGTDTLDRIKLDLERPAMLTRIQTHRWMSGLDRLAGSIDPLVRAGAAQASERLSEWIDDLDQAGALQKDFPQLRVTAEDWQAYRPRPDSALWLIGRTPDGAAARPLVLAVRGERIFESLGSPNLPIEITANGDSAFSHFDQGRVCIGADHILVVFSSFSSNGRYSVSPDGTKLAIATWSDERQPHIEQWDVRGKGYGQSAVGRGLVQCLQWTKDGRSVLFAKSQDGVRWQIMRVGPGGSPASTGLEVTGLTYFDLSPDGSRIAFDGTSYAIRPPD